MRASILRSGQLVRAVNAERSGFFRHSWARSACTGSRPQESQNVLEAYKLLVDTGQLKPDHNQYLCAQRLQRLFDELSRHAPAVSRYEEEARAYMQKRREVRQKLAARDNERAKAEGLRGGWFNLRWLSQIGQSKASSADRIMKEARERELAIDAVVGSPPAAPLAPRGIYLHGNVGSGKTMLMDLFFSLVSKAGVVPRARRVHFNDAMDELHRRMHRLELERAMLDAKQSEEFLQSVAAHEHKGMTDPFAAKQKSMQQAKLATRRLRSQLQKRPGSRASMGTSLILAKAALSLIRGTEDVNLGWDSSSRTASLLCFDELQVGDPFSAIALKGTLEALLDQGTVIVCTSNSPIIQLNRHGIHEDLFTEFQQRMLSTCDEVELSANQDYRLSFGQAVFQEVGGLSWRAGGNYHCPLDAASAEALERAWQQLLEGHSETTKLLHLHYGRKLLVCGSKHVKPVSTAAPTDVSVGYCIQVSRAGPGVARFSFKELCGLPLGLPEYQAVARTFKRGVLISEVPRFSLQMRDQARRFITLVDELYNAKTPLYISADAWPMELFMKPGDTPVLDLEGLQFETAVAGSKLRRDLLAQGNVGALEETNAALSAARSQHSGITEQFAFARAVSRLYELTQKEAQHMSKS